jgi:spermidine synthase
VTVTTLPKIYIIMHLSNAFLPTAFLLSGFCGLIYEVVWERWLELRFGVTTYAAAVIVASFMGGMALGSFFLGRISDRSRRPLRIYGACEFGLGLYALAMPWLVGTAWGGARPAGAVWFLILPTMLMGGTVPSLCRHAASVTKRRASFAWLYGINILGGVAGCLLATVFLLQTFGARITNGLAAAISLSIGIASWIYAAEVPAERKLTKNPVIFSLPATLAVVCGFLSLASEVLWFRSLRLVIGGTIYSFGTILSTYLLGLALGSLIVARSKRLRSRPIPALGITQLWIALFFGIGFPAYVSSWGMLGIFNALYFTHIHSWFAIHAVHFIITCGVLLIPSTLMGMALPLLVEESKTTNTHLGTIYGASSLGAVLGSLAAGFMMIPSLGLEASAFLVCWVETLLAIALLAPQGTPRAARLAAAPALLLLLVASSSFHGGIRPNTLYKKDGVVSSISVYINNGRKVLETDNLDIQGGDPAHPLTHPKRLGYLPLMLHSGASDAALQIGLGTGINLSALAEGVKAATVVELIPEMPEAVAHFKIENDDVLHRANVKLVIDDGRHWVASSPGKYDLIVADLFYPENAGTASLYAREHFLKCRVALKEKGTMVQWIPAHQLTLSSLKTLLATFRSVFPDASLWWGTESETIPALALVGRTGAQEPSVKEIGLRMKRYPGMREVGWERPDCLASLRIMSDKTLTDFAAGAPLNIDDLPHIEYDAPHIETQRSQALFDTLRALAASQDAEAAASANPTLARLLRARASFVRAHAWRSIGQSGPFNDEQRRARSLAPECRDLAL